MWRSIADLGGDESRRILAALQRKKQEGRNVDVSMIDGMLSLLPIMECLSQWRKNQRAWEMDILRFILFNPKCADDSSMCVGNDRILPFCKSHGTTSVGRGLFLNNPQ